MVGGLVIVHGDDAGLRIPPALAPIQVVVIAVKPDVVDAAHRIGRELAGGGLRVVVDDRVDQPFGHRSVAWELRASPCGSRSVHATWPRTRSPSSGGWPTVRRSGLP